MIAFLNAFKLQGLLFHCPLIIANTHLVVFTLPLQTFNQHKGMGLCYASRGGVRNLPPFSPSRCLLQILFFFLTKSGPREPERCGAQNVLLCRFPEVLWTPAQQSWFWCQTQDTSQQQELDSSQKTRQ